MTDTTILESLRVTAQICLDHADIIRDLEATNELWPTDLIPHAKFCAAKSQAIFGTMVLIYLRSLPRRTMAHGGRSGA